MALDTTKFDRLKGLLSAQTSETPIAAPKRGFVGGVADSFSKRLNQVDESFSKDQGIGSKVLQNFGAGFGLIGDVGAEAVKAVVPDAIGKVGVDAVQAVAETEPVKKFMDSYSSWKEQNPEQAANFEATVDIASILPVGGGVGVGAKAGAKAVELGVNATKAAARSTVPTVVANTARGAGNALTLAAEGLSRVPARIATNVAEKSAQREAIRALPTPTARQAANDGIEAPDIEAMYKLPKEQKAPVRQLYQVVKDYASGRSKLNPQEVVGRPIVARIRELDKEAGRIGQELGTVADDLGEVTTRELGTPVFTALKKVRGLQGLQVDKKGTLDFSDTNLVTFSTKADREAIQQIFTDAVKAGTGKQKHLLRQELFEILDGKKKSLQNITGTQENAYQAVRQALSDVLDSKNPNYKALNQEYAKVARPLTDIRKFLRDNGGLDEDLLQMKAGLLARRLTSNAASNPELRAVLRAMDTATKVAGKSQISVENLQDAYNVLSKYYPEIVNKTSLRGEITSGIEGATGIMDALGKFVGDIAGKSNTVKRKAFEQMLDEALR